VVLHVIERAVLGEPVEERPNLVFGRHKPPALQAMPPEYGLRVRNSTLIQEAVYSAA
jgi:hypothetical protein